LGRSPRTAAPSQEVGRSVPGKKPPPVELGDASLRKLRKVIVDAVEEAIERTASSEVRIESLSAGAFLDLVEIVKRALDERDEEIGGEEET
jgi:hypothetical protein